MIRALTSTMTQCGADILVEGLLREGVEVIFAYPGGASMPIHQSLTKYADRIRTILPRNEQGGGFAAEAISRTSNKVGVCLATSGPGATNFTTCLADAKMDSTPIVAITGQVGTPVIGTDAFQETPMVEIARPITKHHYLVTKTEDLPRVIKEAFYIARSGRPGPVLIDIPKDVQNRHVVPDYDAPMNLPGYKPDLRAKSEDLDTIIRFINESKRPVVYAGGGVVTGNASGALREFIERTSIPVAMTLQGLGCFPGTDDLSLHMLGMHGSVYSNYAVDESDLLLAFGVRFDDRVTGKVSEFAKHGRIVHIDIDPSELNKNKKAHVACASDIRYAIEELNKRLDADPIRVTFADWHAKIATWKKSDPLKYNLPADAIVPQHAIKTLWEIIESRGMLDKTIVTTGVGQHQMWAAQYWKFTEPKMWVTSGGLGSMGFGLPSAIGAQAANPDKLVIDVDGDGSFLMNIQELACAFVEKLPVKVLLLNNQHLGMVVQWEDRFYESNRGHTYLGAGEDRPPYPDFVTIAHGFGVKSRTVDRQSELHAALVEMIDSDGPYVLDVQVPHQEHVLPMIPSGQTVREMIKA